MTKYKEPGYNDHPVFPYSSADSINTLPDFIAIKSTPDEEGLAQIPLSEQSTDLYKPPISILEARKGSAFHRVQSEAKPQPQVKEFKSAYTNEPDMDYQSAHTHAAYQREHENPFVSHDIEQVAKPLRDIVAKRLTYAANVLASATNRRIGAPLVRFAFDKLPPKKLSAKHRLEKSTGHVSPLKALSKKQH